MSRLDDELKLIYGRKEPSPDFASRVMRQIAAEPTVETAAARKSLWQSILDFIQPPRVRLAAAGLAACLLVTLFAAQQLRREPPAASEPTVTAQTDAPPTGLPPTKLHSAETVAGSKPDRAEAAQPKPDGARRRAARRDVRYVGARNISARNISARNISARNIGRPKDGEGPMDEKTLAEGKAAKEKVMLALQIASSTLNEAQRMVQGDSRRGDR